MNKIKNLKNSQIKEGMIVFRYSHYGFSVSTYMQVFKVTSIDEGTIYAELMAEIGEFFGEFSIKEPIVAGNHNITFNSYGVIDELNAENIRKNSHSVDSRCTDLLVKYHATKNFNNDLKDLL